MIKVPLVLPGFIEVEADRYKSSEKATVAEWRAAKAFPVLRVTGASSLKWCGSPNNSTFLMMLCCCLD